MMKYFGIITKIFIYNFFSILIETKYTCDNKKNSCFSTNCDIFNDCCENDQNYLPRNETYFGKFECNIEIQNDAYTYSIVKCADWWENKDETREKCERLEKNNSLSNNEIFIRNLPVYSFQTGFIYKNIYCARCSIKTVEYQRLKYLNLMINTHLKMNKSFSLQNLDSKQFENNIRFFLDIKSQKISSQKFDGKNYFFYNFEANNNTFRECVPFIDSCNNKTIKNIEEMCQNKTSIIYSFSKKAYKNEYCAFCNGVKSNKSLSCSRSMISFYRDQFEGLELLFDISEIFDNLFLSAKIRKENNYLDFVEKFCPSNETKTNETQSDLTKTLACKKNLLILPYSQQISLENVTESLLNKLTTCCFKMYMTLIGLSISILSLLVLLIVYSFNKILRNLPGKLLIFLSLSLLFSQLFFLISTYLIKPSNISNLTYNHVNSISEDNIYNESYINFNTIIQPCYVVGLITHYFYLAFFAWSNVIAFDLNKIFSSNLPNYFTSKYKKKRLFLYSLYAWIFPLVFIIFLEVKQFIMNYQSYGVKICFISRSFDLMIFFVIPVGIILILNLIFFINSIVSIKKVDKINKKFLKIEYELFENGKNQLPISQNTEIMEKAATFLSTQESSLRNSKRTKIVQRGKKDRRYLILYIKLFFITGNTWLIGIISSFDKDLFTWYFYVFLNSLQGLFISLSFVFTATNKLKSKK